jgi:hypothetical protein
MTGIGGGPPRQRLLTVLDGLAPGAGTYFVRPSLADDEVRWFLRAVDSGLVQFQACTVECPRRRRFKVTGGDEFATPSGQLRHLFSLPPDRPRLNREYIPHIAAWARAILGAGYDAKQAAFSRYRTFVHDAVTKMAGTGYETDGEFYAPDGSIWLHLEAKRDG